MGDLLLLFFFLILLAIIMMVVYQLICLADLQFDYRNPFDTAARINKVVLPEFITQGVLCFLLLVTRHWVISLFSVPYLYLNIRLYLQRQHLVDVTEIINMLEWEKNKRFLKIGYIIFIIFLCLLRLIYNSLEDEIW